MKTIKKRIPFLLLVFLVLETYVFSLRIIGEGFYSINSNQQGIIATIVVVLLVFLNYGYSKSNFIFKNYVLFFLAIYILEWVYSSIKYTQGFLNAFICSNYYIIILVYFVFSKCFAQNGVSGFNDIVINLSLINMILHSIQYVFYKSGLLFIFFDEENLRMGELRLSHAVCSCTIVGVIIAFSQMITSEHRKKKNIVCFTMGVFSLVFIARSRAAIIGFIITIIVIYAYVNRTNAIKIIASGTMLLIAFILFVNFTQIGKSYMDSFIYEDTGAFRLIETEYYMNQVYENPLLGMGFIRRMGESVETALVSGPRFHYSRTDVGIIGYINTFGIVGLVWYVCFFVRITKEAIRIFRKKDTRMVSVIIIGIYIWNITYLPTLMLFGAFSIFIPALEMAYIDYYNNHISQNGGYYF